MYLVEKTFIDKETKKNHPKDTIYESNKEERIKSLKEKGFLGIELMIKEEEQALKEEDRKEEPIKEDVKRETKGEK